MISTLAQNASNVGLIPALVIIFSIFITPHEDSIDLYTIQFPHPLRFELSNDVKIDMCPYLAFGID